MAKDEYVLIVNPETGQDGAVTEKGFVTAEYEDKGYKVDRWQDGRRYDGSLPKVSKAQREALGLYEPTPEIKTVEGAEAAAEAKADKAAARDTGKDADAEPVEK